LWEPSGIAIDSKGDFWVVDTRNDRVEEFNSEGKYLSHTGSKGKGNGQFEDPVSIAIDSKGNLWVTDSDNDRVEEFNSEGKYVTQIGSEGKEGGQLKYPYGVATGSNGQIWVTDAGNDRVEEFQLHRPLSTRTIYYTAAANTEFHECGEHLAWANLPCKTTPEVQPETSGLPELPVTKYTYNVWNEPETNTETVGAITRTKTATYDPSGRLKTSAITCIETGEKTCPSSDGAALPAVTYEYNSETGALEKESTTTSGKTKTITSKYNRLSELESYTDSDENTTSYEYDIDGRPKKINDKQGTEKFEYNGTTGLLGELVYENGTTKLAFTATYDVEGNMLTESYPNNMTATYTYNPTDKPIELEYKKNAH
jgi:YD repeat-containing protein